MAIVDLLDNEYDSNTPESILDKLHEDWRGYIVIGKIDMHPQEVHGIINVIGDLERENLEVKDEESHHSLNLIRPGLDSYDIARGISILHTRRKRKGWSEHEVAKLNGIQMLRNIGREGQAYYSKEVFSDSYDLKRWKDQYCILPRAEDVDKIRILAVNTETEIEKAVKMMLNKKPFGSYRSKPFFKFGPYHKIKFIDHVVDAITSVD